MKRTITRIIEVEEIKHEFYCDECGKYLGVSYEHDDGWYETLGEVNLSYNVNGFLYLRKCLCDKCKYELEDNIRRNLSALGFTAER